MKVRIEREPSEALMDAIGQAINEHCGLDFLEEHEDVMDGIIPVIARKAQALTDAEPAQRSERERLLDRRHDLMNSYGNSDFRDGLLDEEIRKIDERLAAMPTEAGDVGRDWKHAANEWADVATNGLQWLKNVRDDVASVDAAITALQLDIEQARSAQPQQAEPVYGFAKMASAFMGELAVEMQRLNGSTPDDDPVELRGEVLRYLRSLPDAEALRLLSRLIEELDDSLIQGWHMTDEYFDVKAEAEAYLAQQERK